MESREKEHQLAALIQQLEISERRDELSVIQVSIKETCVLKCPPHSVLYFLDQSYEFIC